MKPVFRPFMIILSLFSMHAIHAQNMLVNPGAENGIPTSNGWTQVNAPEPTCTGVTGWRVQGNLNGYPAPRSGTYFFTPGCRVTGAANGTTYELRQDINVTSQAAAITANAYTVTFSGYLRSFNQTPPDQTRVIVEYRNSTNSTVLVSYNTGNTTNVSNWVNYTDTRNPPTGTRYIRVRLIGTIQNGVALDAYFDDLSITAVSTLPVRLLNFKTQEIYGNKALLQWETIDEVNNKGFYIQRSSDSENWLNINFVPASATPGNQKNYQFTDDELPQGSVIYYRLQQIDIDGTSAFSPVNTIKKGDPVQQTTIYPNPVSDRLYINCNFKILSVEINDINGKLLASETNLSGNSIPVSHLRKGLYTVKIKGPDQLIYKRMIKN